METTVSERLLAYHEAGHALAHYRFDHGIRGVSIRPGANGPACVLPERPAESIDPTAADARVRVEQRVMALHAGAVAEQIYRPNSRTPFGKGDHMRIHETLHAIEKDESVVVAWCTYLWQRTYSFLKDPAQWHAVTCLANGLLSRKRLPGKVIVYLFEMLDEEVAHGRHQVTDHLGALPRRPQSPWHRSWFDGPSSPALEVTPSAEAQKLLRNVLTGLSRRAWRGLELGGIWTVTELENWSPRALRSLKGIGKKTALEIAEAAGRAGIRLPTPGAPDP